MVNGKLIPRESQLPGVAYWTIFSVWTDDMILGGRSFWCDPYLQGNLIIYLSKLLIIDSKFQFTNGECIIL